MYFFIKTMISALIIATVTELSNKAPVGSALIKSLPLTSLIVFIIMKYEGRTNQEISRMSWDILYMVIPSLVLFIIFPLLLNKGWGFTGALFSATVIMSFGYLLTFKLIG